MLSCKCMCKYLRWLGVLLSGRQCVFRSFVVGPEMMTEAMNGGVFRPEGFPGALVLRVGLCLTRHVPNDLPGCARGP